MSFDCLQCIQCCCKNLRADKDIPKDLSGIFDINRSTFTLFEWEATRLLKIAKKRNLSINIIPFHVIYDSNYNKYIALTWTLDHVDCPFLKEEKYCSIYPFRPLTCRAFPIYINSYNESESAEVFYCHDLPADLKQHATQNITDYETLRIIYTNYLNIVRDSTMFTSLVSILDQMLDALVQSGALKIGTVPAIDKNSIEVIPVSIILKNLGFVNKYWINSIIKKAQIKTNRIISKYQGIRVEHLIK